MGSILNINNSDMNILRKKLLEILEGYTIEERSSTGTTGERVIYAPFDDIVDDIIKSISE